MRGPKDSNCLCHIASLNGQAARFVSSPAPEHLSTTIKPSLDTPYIPTVQFSTPVAALGVSEVTRRRFVAVPVGHDRVQLQGGFGTAPSTK